MKALVVGLLPGQAERVKRALPGWRLRFVVSENAKHIRATALHNVLVTSYINHSCQARITKLLQPGQTLHRVVGLDKNVIELLENIT